MCKMMEILTLVIYDDDADDDDDQILNIRILIYIFLSQSFLSFHSYLLINNGTFVIICMMYVLYCS